LIDDGDYYYYYYYGDDGDYYYYEDDGAKNNSTHNNSNSSGHRVKRRQLLESTCDTAKNKILVHVEMSDSGNDGWEVSVFLFSCALNFTVQRFSLSQTNK
jgi:hypothetical protein